MGGVEPDGEGGELVDLDAARRRLGGAYRIPCGKCGRPVHERANRCPHCGVWFDGEAYEFSGPVSLRGRSWRRARSAFWVLLVLVALLVVLLALAGATAGAAAPPAWIVHTFSRQPALRVVVRTADGQPLPGATVWLCPLARPERPVAEPRPDLSTCAAEIADAGGEVRFEGLRADTYRAVVELEGFIGTAVSPLAVAAREYGAPDQILVVLNAWCCAHAGSE